MSIRVSDRRVSEIEFENTGSKICDYIRQKLDKVPVRYRRNFAIPFANCLAEFEHTIIRLADDFLESSKKNFVRSELCKEAITLLEEIASFSYSYWILSQSKKNEIKYVCHRKRFYWAGLVNKEFGLLYGVRNKSLPKGSEVLPMRFMKPYTNEEIKDNDILRKLSELERIAYRVANNRKNNFRDAYAERFVEVCRDASYYAFDAFSKEPETQYLRNRRRNDLNEVIGLLFEANRLIRKMMFDHVLKEKDLEKVCTLSTDVITELKTIRNSDL